MYQRKRVSEWRLSASRRRRRIDLRPWLPQPDGLRRTAGWPVLRTAKPAAPTDSAFPAAASTAQAVAWTASAAACPRTCLQAPGDIAPACHIDCSLSAAACPSDYDCLDVPGGSGGGDMGTGSRKACASRGQALPRLAGWLLRSRVAAADLLARKRRWLVHRSASLLGRRSLRSLRRDDAPVQALRRHGSPAACSSSLLMPPPASCTAVAAATPAVPAKTAAAEAASRSTRPATAAPAPDLCGGQRLLRRRLHCAQHRQQLRTLRQCLRGCRAEQQRRLLRQRQPGLQHDLPRRQLRHRRRNEQRLRAPRSDPAGTHQPTAASRGSKDCYDGALAGQLQLDHPVGQAHPHQPAGRLVFGQRRCGARLVGGARRWRDVLRQRLSGRFSTRGGCRHAVLSPVDFHQQEVGQHHACGQ